MGTSKGAYLANIELPVIEDEEKISGGDLRFYLYHTTKLMGITNPKEYNAYLDSIPRFDKIYDKMMAILHFLEIRVKMEDLRHGSTT